MSKIDQKAFYLVSLGCAKNTVDSESMASLLKQDGFYPVGKPNQAGLIIVNTCGFIQAARQESIDVLTEFAGNKRRGQFLVAAGCLTERTRGHLIDNVPGLDGILGTRRWMDIVDLVRRMRGESLLPQVHYDLPEPTTVGKDERGVLRAAVQGGSAFLKIADGCRRPCAFCSIPLIKGTAVSRPPETNIEEVRQLVRMGVKEVNLIAQDTTDYGHDLGIKEGLASLLEGIVNAAPDLPWVRILYAYPGYVTDRLIDTMAAHPQIVPYLDMPLQHAHPETLKRMRRPANIEWVHNTLGKMRKKLPGLSLRTTFIVGYPGETEEEFQTLLDFLGEIKFDRVGTFRFSFEPGTASEPLGDPVPEEVKHERMERLMLAQQPISLRRNQEFVGKVLPVLAEGFDNGLTVARSYRDAPEIDGYVLVEGELPMGEITPVQITGAMIHDLTAIIHKEK